MILWNILMLVILLHSYLLKVKLFLIIDIKKIVLKTFYMNKYS